MIMPAISFSTMKDKIISGEKKQTIRPKRSDYWLGYEEGDYLVGYWRMRTEGASEKLFESQLSEDPFICYLNPDKYNDGYGAVNFLESLAERDGFDSMAKMIQWFKDKYGEEYQDMEFVVLRWE